MTTGAVTSDVFRGDRDLLIGEFAAQERQLAHEVAALRELIHRALGQLHEQGCQHERLRAQHHRLRDEYRSYREKLLRDDQRRAA